MSINIQKVIFRLFLLSGLAGIMYEVLWIRVFTFLLGSTTQSVSAVITAFMLGIALGNYLIGRLSDKKTDYIFIYAVLEIGTSITSAVAFFLFIHLENLYGYFYQVIPYTTLKWLIFVLAFIFISIPAVLIGGTLPALIKYFVHQLDELKEQAGRLYMINTIGAALGVVLVGFYLIRFIGYKNSVLFTIFLNLVVGLLSLGIWKWSMGQGHPKVLKSNALATKKLKTTSSSENVSPVLILTLFTVSGFTALSYEVIWFRFAEFVFYGTIVGFTVVLSIYLMGLGLGSKLFSKLKHDRISDLGFFSLIQITIGLIAFFTFPFLTLTTIFPVKSIHSIAVILLISVCTLLFGGTFPLAARLYSRDIKILGKSIGNIYTANTLGAVLGSFLTGFFIIPWMGARNTYLILSTINFSVGLYLYCQTKNFKKTLFVGLLFFGVSGLVLLYSFEWQKIYHGKLISKAKRAHYKVIDSKESDMATLNVLQEATEGARILTAGPFISGGTALERRYTQKLQAHLPMLFHPNPQKILEIGYGIGEILKTINLYEPKQIDLVEIEEKMIPYADQHFSEVNNRISESDNINVHIMDGRHFLKMTNEKYDLIMSDSMALLSEGSLRLYTLEHFQMGREHLSDDGMMLLWMPLWVGEERTKVILKTFIQVFPESIIWIPRQFDLQVREAFVLGFKDNVQIHLDEFYSRFEDYAKADLEKIGWNDPEMILYEFKGGPKELFQITQNTKKLNRDMSPVLDFINPFQNEINLGFIRFLSENKTYHLDEYVVGKDRLKWIKKMNLSREKIQRADEFYSHGKRLMKKIKPKSNDYHLHGDALFKYPLKAFKEYKGHPYAKIMLSHMNQEIAKFLLTHGRNSDGLWHLRESLKIYPYNFRANLLMTRYHLKRIECEEAKEYFSRAGVMDPYSKKLSVLKRGISKCEKRRARNR